MDITGNYAVTFVVFGIVQFIASAVLFSLPVVMNLENNGTQIQD